MLPFYVQVCVLVVFVFSLCVCIFFFFSVYLTIILALCFGACGWQDGELKLARKSFDDEVMTELAKVIPCMGKDAVTGVDLSDNKFGDAAAVALAAMLQVGSVVHVFLSLLCCVSVVCVCVGVLSFLQDSNCSVHKLDLRKTKIGAPGIDALKKAVLVRVCVSCSAFFVVVVFCCHYCLIDLASANVLAT